MYSGLLLLAAIIFPLPAIIKGIKKGQNPYRTVTDGIITAGVGLVFIYILSSVSAGGIAVETEESIRLITESLGEKTQEYKEYLARAVTVLPAAMLCLSAVCGYAEYKGLYRILQKDNAKAMEMPPFRDFSWPRNSIYGWFLIFIISWTMKAAGSGLGEITAANINVIFETAFAFQGAALVFMIFFIKKIPKALAVILVIAAWIVPFGKNILFMAGIADIVLGIKIRISRNQ